MKVALKKDNIDWILSHFIRSMSLNDTIEISAARLKLAKGANCVYIDYDLVVRVIELAIDNCRNIDNNFFHLCSKVHNKNKNKNVNHKKYGIIFNSSEKKIKSIKAYRELLRNDVIIDYMGKVYDSGLGTIKQTVEANVVLGPFSKKEIKTVEIILNLLNTEADYKVVEIEEGMETLVKDHEKYLWNRN
ncbi:hypothetical protein M0R04_04855 [Candidatus Dojkabacteria bacterium]|jgi:hypothetical protein|nr:hypothetical protein [Candidatus Dojkabacteria bacterium]